MAEDRDPGLVPAPELAQRARRAWPGENDDYGRARTELLAEEIDLRRHIERVAERRRALPPGPSVREDYAFVDEHGKRTPLSRMFGERDTLVVYVWMYGPARKQACPMCTSLLAALEAQALHIEQNVALAVVGRSSIDRQLAFKQDRGWQHLKFFSTDGNAFANDYRAVGPKDEDWPAMLVFKRDAAGTVRLFWSEEMGDGTADPGQDPRGAPDLQPLWNVLDLTPHGRRSDWYPKLDYPVGA